MSDTMIQFTVEGDPVAQGRPRFTKNGHAYDPAKSRAYKELVALRAREAMAGRGPMPRGTAAYCIIEVRCRMPQRFTKRQREDARLERLLPTKKPDADNIAKAIMDGMAGIVYEDDAQVARVSCRKRYGEEPGVYVVAGKIGEG